MAKGKSSPLDLEVGVKYQLPDELFIDPKNKVAQVFELKKTKSGALVSVLSIQWTSKSEKWVESFRLKPLSSIHFVIPNNPNKRDWNNKITKVEKLNLDLAKDLNLSLPIEELTKYPDLIGAWLEIRKAILLGHEDYVKDIGVNKLTTIDYLNLQSLGILNYQKILGNLYKSKPLTIRDRIAYARRHAWIPSVNHGDKKTNVNEVIEN